MPAHWRLTLALRRWRTEHHARMPRVQKWRKNEKWILKRVEKTLVLSRTPHVCTTLRPEWRQRRRLFNLYGMLFTRKLRLFLRQKKTIPAQTAPMAPADHGSHARSWDTYTFYAQAEITHLRQKKKQYPHRQEKKGHMPSCHNATPRHTATPYKTHSQQMHDWISWHHCWRTS